MRLFKHIIVAFALALLPARAETISTETASRLADLALACVDEEYQNKLAHVMNGDDDAQPPRWLTPAFYGCYDWHSAVHGPWPGTFAAYLATARVIPPTRTSPSRSAAAQP